MRSWARSSYLVAEVLVLYRTFILSRSLGSPRSLHDPYDPYDLTTSRDTIAANPLDQQERLEKRNNYNNPRTPACVSVESSLDKETWSPRDPWIRDTISYLD
jgi:hypothetical protein